MRDTIENVTKAAAAATTTTITTGIGIPYMRECVYSTYDKSKIRLK